MHKKRQELLELIKEYIACSQYMCRLLEDSYKLTDASLLRARRINLIPKEGFLLDGIHFNFHGGGCYFEFETGSIDVDFGPDDRCDGFDSFRLYDFLRTSKTDQYIHLISEYVIGEELQKLLDEKVLIKPGLYPNPHLFYMSSAKTVQRDR